MGTVGTPDVAVHGEGNPDTGEEAGFAAVKVAWRDADDGVGMAVELNGLAKDVRVEGKVILPDRIANDRDRGAVELLFFFRNEAAAEDWVDTEDIKIVCGCERTVDALRFGDVGEGHVIVVVACESGEGAGTFAQIAKIGIREGRAGMVAALATHDSDDVAGVSGTWNGVEEGRADPAEDRGIGGDAEGEGESSDQREARRLGEHADGVAEVVEHRVLSMARSRAQLAQGAVRSSDCCHITAGIPLRRTG